MHASDDVGGLRVALVSSSFAPHVGGVETHVASVAENLIARGNAVEVWTVDRGRRAGTGRAYRVRYLPTPLPARRARSLLAFCAEVPSAWSGWMEAARAFRPDVLAVQCFGPNGLYALGLHRRLRVPLVVTSHGETLGDDTGIYSRSALLRRGLRAAIASASSVTAPSDYVLADLRSRFGLREGIVIPNGVDEQSPIASVERRGDLLLAVARLGRMKGLDLLIDAFVEADIEGLRLEIVGDGPERGALQEQIDASGFCDRIVLAGEVSPAAVSRRIAQATAVVVPSRSEAFGIVALEAWRGGAPLIMSSRGGAAEFIRDGEDGLLVDPTDTGALASAMRRITADGILRAQLAESGRARVDAFRWPGVAATYEQVFRESIAGVGRRA